MQKILIFALLLVMFFAWSVCYAENPPAFSSISGRILEVTRDRENKQWTAGFQSGTSLTAEVADAYAVFKTIDFRDKDYINILVKNTDDTNGITVKITAYAYPSGSLSDILEDTAGNTEIALAAGETLAMSTSQSWSTLTISAKNTVPASAGEIQYEYIAKEK